MKTTPKKIITVGFISVIVLNILHMFHVLEFEIFAYGVLASLTVITTGISLKIFE